jgi:hypothetical protein
MKTTYPDPRRRIIDVTNHNESRLNIFDELPAAEEYWRGKIVLLEAPAAEDELQICVRESAGTYAWKGITLS